MRFVMTTLLLFGISASAPGQFIEDSSLRSWIPKSVPVPRDVRFYDHRPVFQQLGGRSGGIPGGPRLHATSQNIAGSLDRTGNANFEFPWKHTAGLADGMNAKTLRFVYLSEPVEWWREHRVPPKPSIHSANDIYDAVTWQYAPGTVFGECIMVTDQRGYDHTCEVRLRTKDEDGQWRGEVYTPDLSVSPVTERVQRLRGFRIDKKLALTVLPSMDAHALDGAKFVKDGRNPWTTDHYSVVPVGYTGTITSCVTCHQQVGMAASEIQPGRDWYGVVRGSDQAFSFSIFAPNATRPEQLDERLLRSGLLKKWRPRATSTSLTRFRL